jgi:hypothetical protein
METTFLYYDKEWKVWQVLHIDSDGHVDDEKIYYTDDYHDAISTQKVMNESIHEKEIENEREEK